MFVGIDLSLTSPGMAIRTGDQWFVYGFAQLKRQLGLAYSGTNWSASVLPPIPPGTNVERYTYIVNALVELVQKHGKVGCVTMEMYAFGCQSAHTYKLQELGGIVQFVFAQNGYSVKMVPIGTWKKSFTGNGHADKRLVFQTVVDKLFPIHEAFPQSSTIKVIPSPLQDMCDAVGLVAHAMVCTK
jgi:Holliday junction resolvasome RuvABC endonuclease subunit